MMTPAMALAFALAGGLAAAAAALPRRPHAIWPAWHRLHRGGGGRERWTDR